VADSLVTVTVCRHCNKHPVNRPRGLCWKCFYTPGVRALYPANAILRPDLAAK
jgi:hypothetical protein